MPLNVNHNIAAHNSWRRLGLNEKKMDKSLEKLSSGYAINRASDNPTELVISEQWRSEMSSVKQTMSNAENSISMIQTAEGSLNEINNLLVNMRQLILHASNKGGNDPVSIAADQAEIDNAIQAIERAAIEAKFGKQKLLSGNFSITNKTEGEGMRYISASTETKPSPVDGYPVQITQVATKASIEGKRPVTLKEAEKGVEFTFLEKGKKVVYRTVKDDTPGRIMAKLRDLFELNGLNLKISLTEDNRFRVEHNEYGSKPTFKVAVTAAGILTKTAYQAESALAGKDIEGYIGGENAEGTGQYLTGAAKTRVEGLKIQYSGEKQAGDKPEGVVHLKQNSMLFQIGPHQGDVSKINLLSIFPKDLAKGVPNASGFKNLQEIRVESFSEAQDSLLIVDKAISEISAFRGKIGAFQKNTLDISKKKLGIAYENAVSSESQIRDTDMAKELVRHTRNEIMLNADVALLGQANNLPKTILNRLSNRGG